MMSEVSIFLCLWLKCCVSAGLSFTRYICCYFCCRCRCCYSCSCYLYWQKPILFTSSMFPFSDKFFLFKSQLMFNLMTNSWIGLMEGCERLPNKFLCVGTISRSYWFLYLSPVWTQLRLHELWCRGTTIPFILLILHLSEGLDDGNSRWLVGGVE